MSAFLPFEKVRRRNPDGLSPDPRLGATSPDANRVFPRPLLRNSDFVWERKSNYPRYSEETSSLASLRRSPARRRWG
jgi:hypothetical protein